MEEGGKRKTKKKNPWGEKKSTWKKVYRKVLQGQPSKILQTTERNQRGNQEGEEKHLPPKTSPREVQ